MKIICKVHGGFEQQPANHFMGNGCPACAGLNQTTEDFISKATSVHGDRYNYSLSDYKGMKTKLKIICKEHGVFNQIPNSHLRGVGCPDCANTKLSTEDFISKASKVHEDKYDYSLSDYKTGHTKLKVICKEHGDI